MQSQNHVIEPALDFIQFSAVKRKYRRPADQTAAARVAVMPRGPAPAPALGASPAFPSARQGTWWNQGCLPALLLMIVTFLAYLPVWHAGFIWDDDRFLTENPLIKAPNGLYQFWFTAVAPDYFPLTSSSLWLEWRLWGLNPLGYHLVNVLLHSLSAILLWRVLVRLIPHCNPAPWLAAALFALHPANVESVAWITERKNTLAMFFFALTLLSYLKFDDLGLRRWYVMSLAAFLLALLSKTAVVPLPFVLLAVAWWRRGRVTTPDILRAAPFFVCAAVLGLLTVWFQYHRAIGPEVVRSDSFPSRVAGAGWAVWFYLYTAVCPINLMFVYPRWKIPAANPLSYVPGLLLVSAAAVLWRFQRQSGRICLFALGFFVLMLLPVLGFLNIYFMRYSLVADHYQYFSILAPLALAAAGFRWAWMKWAPRRALVGPLLSIFLLAALATLTWRQCQTYTDAERLWRVTLDKNPGCTMARYNLARFLYQRGRWADAALEYQAILRANALDAGALSDLGAMLLEEGRLDEAITNLQRALQIQPNRAEAYKILGNVMVKKGSGREAIACYEESMNLACDQEILKDLAWVLATSPDPATRNGPRAVELAARAYRLSGGRDALVVGTLAAAYAETGRFPEAMSAAQRALDLAGAQNNSLLFATLQSHLQLYRDRKPLRDVSPAHEATNP